MEPRILFVTPISPFAPKTGGEQRSQLMFQSLCALGQVDVIQLCPGSITSISEVNKHGARWVFASVANAELTWRRFKPKTHLTKPVEKLLGQRLSDYDLVVGRYIWPVCQLEIPANVPVIADLDDLLFRANPRALAAPSVLKMWLKKKLGSTWTNRQIRRFDGAFFVSGLDQKLEKNTASRVVPNIPIACVGQITPPPFNKQVLFVGSLWYPPNEQGINWFLNAVWPQVLANHADATLLLAGSANSRVRSNWERIRGVKAPGFVDDLEEAYQNAAVVIVPIWCGGGSNIKLVEALAHLRPCVTTRTAYSPFSGQLKNNQHLLVAENAGDFAGHINDLMINPALGQNLALAGRNAVEENFAIKNFEVGVAQLVGEVLARRQSNRPKNPGDIYN